MFGKRVSGYIDHIAFFYLGMCIVYFLEFILCFIYSNFIFTHIIGLAALAVIYRFREPVARRPIPLIIPDILRAVLFSALALAAVFIVDFAVYKHFGSPHNFFNLSDNIFYYSYGYSLESLGKNAFIFRCAIGIAISAVQAIFVELLFRLQVINGLLNSGISPIASNFIQALFYGVWMSLQNVFLLLFFQYTPCIPYLFLYFIFGFIFGLALGFLSLATQGIWASVIASIIYYILINMVHFTSFSGNIYESSVIIIVYEFVFLIISLVYYLITKLRQEKAELNYYYHIMKDDIPE